MNTYDNRYYGATGFHATVAFCVNAANFSGRSTRAECWWLAPWVVLIFNLQFSMVLAHPVLIYWLAFILCLPSAALLTRRYRDAGLPAALGGVQAVIFGLIWTLFEPQWAQVGNGIIAGFGLMFWLVSLIAMVVILFLPTSQHQRAHTPVQAQLDYRAANKLSAADLSLFRETMTTALAQIKHLERLGKKPAIASWLEASEGLDAAKALFAFLMTHPQQMTTHGDWLYHSLPTLNASCDRLLEIAASAVDTQAVDQMRADIQKTAETAAAQIAADYAQALAETASALEDGVPTYAATQRSQRFDSEYQRLFIGINRPNAARKRRRRILSNVWLVLSVALILAGILTKYHITNQIAAQVTPAPDLVDHYPLISAKVKPTGSAANAKTLVVTHDGDRLVFNNGYTITVTHGYQLEDVKHTTKATPSFAGKDDSYPASLGTLNATIDNAVIYIVARMDTNLRRGVDALHPRGDEAVIKVFPQAQIGQAKTGYIFDVPGPKEKKDYARAYYYVLFPDGTGVTFKSFSDRTPAMAKLTQASRLSAFATAFGTDYHALTQAVTLR